MKLRLWISAAALAMSAGAYAQTVQVQTSSPVLDVQRLAPQLLAFAGGDVNFANLVNGLALGLPITLTTPVGPAVAGGTTVRNTSDSPFGRGISDTPQTLVPGVTIGPTAPMTTGTAPTTPAPFGAAGTTTATPTARPAPFGAR